MQKINSEMDYELAVKLKEAGFSNKYLWTTYSHEANEHYLPAPTLSELIESCGDNFDFLQRIDDGWEAHSHAAFPNNEPQWANTPEEAVARLWLELHPPKADVT